MSEDGYLKHNDIMNMAFTTDENDDCVYAIQRNLPLEEQHPFLAFGIRVAPILQFFRLLTAAPLLYQCLTRQMELLDKMIGDLDKLPKMPHTDALRETLATMRKLTNITQTFAVEGISGVPNQVRTPNVNTN